MAIRTVVAGLPRMLADLVFEALHHPPDMVVSETDEAAVTAPDSRLGALLVPGDVHAVVVGVDGVEHEMALSAIAFRHPHLVVMAMSMDGRTAWLVRVVTDRIPIEEVSPDGLRRSIRAAIEARV